MFNFHPQNAQNLNQYKPVSAHHCSTAVQIRDKIAAKTTSF